MKSKKDINKLSALSDLSGKNWSWVKLGDVCEIIMGQSPPSSTYNTEGIGLPFFQGKAEFTELYPEVKKWCSESKKIAEPKDILVSVRAPVGSTNIANKKCCIGRGLAAIRYPNCNKYIFYYFRLIENKLDELGTGSTFKAISSKTLTNLEIPLPPLSEQKKIVEKIEELFSSLDSGIASLKKAKEQLRLYRQSVLAFAFSGKLTTKVTQFTKNLSELSALSGLPQGWKWVKLGEVTNNFDGQRIPLSKEVRAKRKGEYRYYGATEIIDYIDDYIFDGTYLLIGEDGANLLSRSRPLSFIVEGKFWVNNHAHVLQTTDDLNIKYLNYYFNSIVLDEFITGSAQPKLTQKNLNKISIPFAPANQQQQIVSEIEKRFSEADNLEKAIDESLVKSEALRQSILKQAFEGKLV